MFRKSLILLLFTLLLPGSIQAKLSSSEFSRAKKKLFRALNGGGDPREAISDVAADDGRKGVELLLKVALANVSTKAYNAILSGLASMQSADAIKAMAKKLKGGKWTQKVIVATVFGKFSDDKSAQALVKALKDRYPPVVRTVIKSIGQRKIKAAVDELIKLVKKHARKKGLLWLDARQGLTTITGKDFLTADEWQKWWSFSKSSFDPNAVKGDQKTATVEKKGPRFFTEQIISKRVIFIIDTSGSMRAEDPASEKGGGGVRIKRAKSELIKVIKNLSKKVKFNIVAFSDKIKPWQKGRLVYASRGFKYGAIKFVDKLKATGLTRTDKALTEAFKSREANAFYLLSDGAPTMADKKQMRAVLIQPSKILEQVRKQNRFRKIKIYTMGFAEEAKKPNGAIFVNFLKQLAKENEGRFSPIN